MRDLLRGFLSRHITGMPLFLPINRRHGEGCGKSVNVQRRAEVLRVLKHKSLREKEKLEYSLCSAIHLERRKREKEERESREREFGQ